MSLCCVGVGTSADLSSDDDNTLDPPETGEGPGAVTTHAPDIGILLANLLGLFKRVEEFGFRL